MMTPGFARVLAVVACLCTWSYVANEAGSPFMAAVPLSLACGLLAVYVIVSELVPVAARLEVVRDRRVIEAAAHEGMLVAAEACGHGAPGRVTRRSCDCAVIAEIVH